MSIPEIHQNSEKSPLSSPSWNPSKTRSRRTVIPDSFLTLTHYFDVYILSTIPWENHTAASDKFQWVKKYLGPAAHERLILTHHKKLNIGDYLIDDQISHGVDKFIGEHIHFGSAQFPDWQAVLKYLIPS